MGLTCTGSPSTGAKQGKSIGHGMSWLAEVRDCITRAAFSRGPRWANRHERKGAYRAQLEWISRNGNADAGILWDRIADQRFGFQLGLSPTPQYSMLISGYFSFWQPLSSDRRRRADRFPFPHTTATIMGPPTMRCHGLRGVYHNASTVP